MAPKKLRRSIRIKNNDIRPACARAAKPAQKVRKPKVARAVVPPNTEFNPFISIADLNSHRGTSDHLTNQDLSANNFPVEGNSIEMDSVASQEDPSELTEEQITSFLEAVFISLGFFQTTPISRINPNLDLNNYPVTANIMQIRGLLQKYSNNAEQGGPPTSAPAL